MVGGGQHARVVLDCLMGQGADVLAIFDPKYKGDLFGVPQRGAYDAEFEPAALAIIAVGDNATRKKISKDVSHGFVNTVHPSVIFSPFASLGTGNMLLHGSIIQSQAKIGNHVIINTGAQIDHDCVIGDYVHLAPRVVLCGRVEIGEGALVGAGATITPGKKIGAWSIIGAGSVVIDDVPDHAVVVGNPSKVIKYN